MSTMHEATPTQDPADAVTLFFMEVERIRGNDPWVSPLGGGILAGLTLDIAHSSRAFSRALGIEHALVLREIKTLVDLGRLIVRERNERTQGCTYALVPLPVVIPTDEKPIRRPPSLASGSLIASTGRATRGGCSSKGGSCGSALPRDDGSFPGSR